MIAIDFDYTPEDLKEANRGHAKSAGMNFGKRRSGLPRWSGYVLFGGLAVVLFLLLQRTPRAVSPTPPIVPPPGQDALLDRIRIILPWVLVFSFIYFFAYRTRFGSVKRAWDSEPWLQFHKRVQADDRHFVLDDRQMHLDLQWSAFRRFLETPNLFLLYTSGVAFHMIPKRAFSSPGQLDEFRRLIEQQIQPPTGGFPVQQQQMQQQSTSPPAAS